MIKQLIGIPLIILYWIVSAKLESWYWILRKIIKSMLDDIKTLIKLKPTVPLQEVWDTYTKQYNDLPYNSIYHIPRAITTLVFLYLTYILLGFELALYLNAIGMIVYEFINSDLMHGSWKFYKKWGYKIGNLKIPYPTYAAWCCIAIINLAGIFKVLSHNTADWTWWIFYGISIIGYWVFSIWNHKVK